MAYGYHGAQQGRWASYAVPLQRDQIRVYVIINCRNMGGPGHQELSSRVRAISAQRASHSRQRDVDVELAEDEDVRLL